MIDTRILGISQESGPKRLKDKHSTEHVLMLSNICRNSINSYFTAYIDKALFQYDAELLDKYIFFRFFQENFLNIITYQIFLFPQLMPFQTFLFKRTDNTFQYLKPLLLSIHDRGQKQHPLEHPPDKTTMTMRIPHQFFIILFKEKIFIDIRIMHISLLIVFPSLF